MREASAGVTEIQVGPGSIGDHPHMKTVTLRATAVPSEAHERIRSQFELSISVQVSNPAADSLKGLCDMLLRALGETLCEARPKTPPAQP